MVTTVSLEEVMLNAAREVFESMVFMPLERSTDSAPDSGDMAFLATITFTGDLEGGFSISCPHSSTQAVAASMLCLTPGEPLGEAEMTDALGEIANMIMGGIKTRIQQEVARIEISVPCVICGRQLRNRLGEGTSRIAMPVILGSEHRAELSLLYRCHTS
jgi:chemotaxis protein CheX